MNQNFYFHVRYDCGQFTGLIGIFRTRAEAMDLCHPRGHEDGRTVVMSTTEILRLAEQNEEVWSDAAKMIGSLVLSMAEERERELFALHYR